MDGGWGGADQKMQEQQPNGSEATDGGRLKYSPRVQAGTTIASLDASRQGGRGLEGACRVVWLKRAMASKWVA